MNIYVIQQFIRIKNYYPNVNKIDILYLLSIKKRKKFPVVLSISVTLFFRFIHMASILLKANSSLNRLYPKAAWYNFPPVYIYMAMSWLTGRIIIVEPPPQPPNLYRNSNLNPSLQHRAATKFCFPAGKGCIHTKRFVQPVSLSLSLSLHSKPATCHNNLPHAGPNYTFICPYLLRVHPSRLTTLQ